MGQALSMVRHGIILFISLMLAFGAVQAHAFTLRTAAQDSPPKYIKGDDGAMQGLCVEIMQAIMATDSTIDFTGYQKTRPFKRIQSELASNELDVFFGFKKTSERSAIYQFSALPLYEVNYTMAVRRSDRIQIESLDEIMAMQQSNTILTMFGTASERFLKSHSGLSVDSNAKTISANLGKLAEGRGRFFYYHDIGLIYSIKQEELENTIRLLPFSFGNNQHYVAFSPATPKETIKRVDAAIQRLVDSGELARILKRYTVIGE